MPDIISNIQLPQPRKNWIHRQRALDLLFSSLDSRLILVVAGPGYGKTGLLAQFAKIEGFAFSWLTLDDREQDLRVFGEALVASVQQVYPSFGQQTSQLLTSSAAIEQNVGPLVRTFARELAASLIQPTCLVLDDFHVVESSTSVVDFINRLIGELPDDAHLIIASRNLPPLQLGILIAQQQVTALGQSVLRLDQDETRQLLAALNTDQETDVAGEAERVFTATEGWLVGVVMTNHIERMRRQEIGLGAPRARDLLADYLLVRVLQGLPESLQEFLLRSAVPEEIAISFCSREIGWTDTEARVHELERRNLFIQPIGSLAPGGSQETVYRYHPLFREFLLQRLREDDPIRFAQLQHDVGAAYARDGRALVAARHFIIGGWSDDAIHLIEANAPEMLQRGHYRTVLDWLARLDATTPGARRDRHLLWQYEILANLNLGQDAQAMMAVDKLDELYTRVGDLSRRDGLSIRRALLQWRAGNFAKALTSTEVVIHSVYPQPLWVQMEAYRIAAMCQFELGSLNQALEFISRAEQITQNMGRAGYEALARVKLTRTTLLDAIGDTGGALRACYEAESLAEQIQDDALTAEATVQMVEQLVYNSKQDGLLEMARHSLELADMTGNQALRSYALSVLALVLMLTDKAEEALQSGASALTLARQITRTNERSSVLFLALTTQVQTLYRCAFNAASGQQRAAQLQQALGLSREAVAVATVSGSPRARLQAYTRLGTVQAAQGDLELAMESLQRAGEARGAFNDNAAGQALVWQLVTEWQQEEPDFGRVRELAGQITTLIDIRQQDYFVRAEGDALWQLYQDLSRTANLERLRKEGGAVLAERVAVRPASVHPPASVPHIQLVHHDLRVLGFGPGQVWRGDHVITQGEWGWNLPRELFFYILTLHQSKRADITLALWPDSPPSAAVSSFHSAKLAIKKALGRQAMVHVNGLYTVDSGMDYLYDVSNFEQLVAEAEHLPPPNALENLIEAAGLYQADFLTDSSKDWAGTIRRELLKKYTLCCLAASKHALDLGTPEAVLDVMELAAQRDELNEELARLLISLQWRAGKRATALETYAHLRTVLHDEIGITPDAETEQLIRLIKEK